MVQVSVVIIAKNIAGLKADCIEKVRLITNDVVVICNGNTNEGWDMQYQHGCRIYKKAWEGYGANKNKGIEAAKYNWILSVDADEVPDDELVQAINNLILDGPDTVYDIKFKSYFGKKLIRFGSWGRDHHIRLFNRDFVKWSEAMVHETLILPENVRVKKIPGAIQHYSVNNIDEFDDKGLYYAKLSAKKYFRKGIKASPIKLYLSPVFGFIKNYVFFLGILDGLEGWDIAKTTYKNTRRKYLLLNQLESFEYTRRVLDDKLAVDY
jgi:glycosyltransferase involved in cell wall biosynthesis